DAEGRRRLPVIGGQGHGEIAALQPFGAGSAHKAVERIEAGGKTAAHLEGAAIDAFQLPPPEEVAPRSLAAGKTRHAGNGHAVPLEASLRAASSGKRLPLARLPEGEPSCLPMDQDIFSSPAPVPGSEPLWRSPMHGPASTYR